AKDTIEQLKALALDLRQQGQPNDNVVRTLEMCRDQLKGVHQAITGTAHRRRSTRGSGGAVWEDPGRNFQDAMSWIAQQKVSTHPIITASWGEDPAAIEQQLVGHQRFHSSIQRSAEVERAREELMKKGDRGNLYALDQEWDSLQKMSFGRTQQLQELQQIMQEMSKEIMWVNDREEEELVFDWGDKNIDQYIPRKQESYSKLMSDLEVKERELNKLKAKADALLKSNHPASDKIEAYRDTLQTQWSWLLQITKCIDVHLKENAAYNQFFKEANDTYIKLQKEHETVRKKFTCNKNTSLEDLLQLLQRLERERERIKGNKRQVQHLVANSKNIVRLKPRNPEEKSSSPVIVKALCDFIQDQKVICKGNEAILKNNSQRSKWEVTGPGGLDMTVPSVCLIIPPPNPLSVGLANKNEQYYEAILSIWNQLYINAKSLIAWQYCILDIKRINSLTISMLAKMRPEEYRQIIKSLETHFEEFKVSSQDSQMFADEDKKSMEHQVNGAQTHYDQLVVQLPVYIAHQEQWEVQQVAAEEEAVRLEEERRRVETKKQVAKKESTTKNLSDLHALRLRLEGAEGTLSQHVHICLGDDAVYDCGLKITQLESVLLDIDSMREEYQRLRERIVKELESMSDPDKVQFLRSEITIIDQRLAGLEGGSSAHLQRLRALRDLLESLSRAEDIVKVHEARLAEKETTSLTPSEVQDYVLTLKNIKAQLDQKKDVLASMETELAKVSHWTSQVGGAWPKCDMMLSRYTEQVGLLGDRWRRINGQIDTRLQDLQSYQPQLQRYQESSASFDNWIEATRRKQQSLQTTKIDNIQTLTDHINQQKALNSEIKSKREILDGVLKDNTACGDAIRDYESDLAAYTSGLETLLNIPIKRTMLKSPTVDLNQEAAQLQTRYMELLTMSADYYRFLGDLLKNMEELKIRNTKIDLLEEELHLLKENIQNSNAKNKALDDDLGRHKLELSQLRDNLLSVEEVKETTVLKCNAAKQSLDSTQSKLSELSDQVTRLSYMLEEEKRKRRLAEERYSHQQEEYDSVLRRRQKELETLSWSKMELEKNFANKEHEIELLRRQLDEGAEKVKELQAAMSKTSLSLHSLQSQHTEVVAERDALLLKLQWTGKDKDRLQKLEEELIQIKLTLESELRNKQTLMDENQRLKNEEGHWKNQYDGNQSLIRQYAADKEHLEMEKNSLRSDIEKLKRELRELEDRYKIQLTSIQNELREDPETELNVSYRALIERCLTEPHTGLQLLPISEKTDPSKLLFDGVRKDVTAQQLLDCGVLDRLTFDQLVKGEKNVSEVAIDKKLFLKGTGSIAGVAAGPFGKMSFTEAKKQKMMSPESADLLLEAQAATGHLIDPRTNGKMTVKEACANGVMDPEDEPKLLVAEAAAMGYLDPHSGTILSAGQAVNKGLLNKDTALRLLQAQQSVGGILDPTLSVFLPKDIAINRGIIDEDLYGALNRYPQCYLDPDSQQATTYLSLKTKCKIDPNSGFLLLPEPEKPLTVQGLRGHVSVIDLVEANLLERHDIDRVREGWLTKQQIESSLYSYLRGSTCIAGVYTDQAMPIYRAMKEGLLQPYSALELLEAQAASGFIVDPVNNLYLTVTDAYTRNLFGPEFKGNLQAAEKAVTGYKEAGTDKTISLFQAIERGLVDKGRGMRLLEAQIASGGVIDPEHGHRVNMDVANRRGYFDEKMSKVLSVQSADYKGFLDPNTDENLTYAELKKRCITDKTTGLILLPILDESKKESTTKNTLRKRRVVIVDPETNRQMTIREAYDKGYIDSQTFLELAKQECEWEEITIVDPDGSTRFVIIDKKTEKKYDITELLEKRLISQSDLDRYRSQSITLNEFANIITKRTSAASAASSVTSVTSLSSSTSPVEFSSSSKTLETSGPLIIKSTSTSEAPGEQEPVGAIFDTENLQKISVTEALNCGLVDSVTAQRLLEAQACTGGIINPINGQKLGLQEASRLGIITEDMGSRLKPAQKAYFGFEDIKHKKKMSAAEAMKEMWLPYEAGQRFMEFQVVTGGLYDPEVKCRRTIQDALEMGWLDERTAHKLQDVAHHTKNLTCPKSKLKISYKEALDNCMVEQETGVKMLQASSVSSRGISSPYNVASAPGSSTGSRSGSRRSSRRSS
uniref:Desmoplakin b n=1 Tax=Tetraodon nigroviridis TaxID=99883 RepID=H3C7U6_TETNG